MFKFRKKKTAAHAETLPKDDFAKSMAARLDRLDEIDGSMYPKYNVKRGLRNANGTGVVVGLTKIGEVLGYTKDENNSKIPMDGELYYRGYNIKDLIKNYVKENHFDFEEVHDDSAWFEGLAGVEFAEHLAE